MSVAPGYGATNQAFPSRISPCATTSRPNKLFAWETLASTFGNSDTFPSTYLLTGERRYAASIFATTEVRPQILHRRHRVCRFVIFQSPLLLRAIQQPEIIDDRILLRRPSRLDEIRYRHIPEENRNHRCRRPRRQPIHPPPRLRKCRRRHRLELRQQFLPALRGKFQRRRLLRRLLAPSRTNSIVIFNRS